VLHKTVTTPSKEISPGKFPIQNTLSIRHLQVKSSGYTKEQKADLRGARPSSRLWTISALILSALKFS
jgi:hypothetical protein